MNVLKQMELALFEFKRYGELAYIKTGKLVKYILFLTFLMLLGFASTTVPMYIEAGGMRGIAENYIPEFTIKDGVLKTDKIDFTDDRTSSRIYVDTKAKELDTALGRGYGTVFIANGTECYIVSNGVTDTLKWKDFGNLTKKELVNNLSSKSFIFWIAVIFAFGLFIMLGLSLVVNITIYTCISNLLVFFMKIKLGFWKVFRVCTYALTLPVIINIILGYFGIALPGIITFITFCCIYKALYEIKKNEAIIIAELE